MVYIISIGIFCLFTVVFNSLSLIVKEESKKTVFSTIGGIFTILEGLVFVAGQRSGLIIAAGVLLVSLGSINIYSRI